MVQLQAVRDATNALPNQHQKYTAVFVGATTGIGENTLRALANAYAARGNGLSVYIVGRNETSAAKIIADCAQLCPAGHFEFIKSGDLALLGDVDAVCKEVTRFVRAGSGLSLIHI